MHNADTSTDLLLSTELDQSSLIREQILSSGSLREHGGVGFSILSSLGVSFPEATKFNLTECMREDEITETWKLLEEGKKVWWEGGDGFGKTTFLGEMGAYIEFQNSSRSVANQLKMIHLDSLTRGNRGDIQRELSRLEYYSTEGAKFAPNRIYILDAADYLWEQVDGESWFGATAQFRIDLLKKLIGSKCKMVMTAHDHESKNKKVDPVTKRKCQQVLSHESVVQKKLSPLYGEDKMRHVLGRVGFPRELVDKLFADSFYYPIRHHGLMTNYVLGNQDRYRLRDLISYIDSALKSTTLDTLSKTLKDLLTARNSQRIKDWLEIGF